MAWLSLRRVVIRRGPCWRTWSWRSGRWRARGWRGLVFGDADDPRGALRWTLAQLRRALGVAGALRGDPLELGLPAGAAVDVLSLVSGEPDPALVRGELLEGLDPGAGAEFEAWLLVERRRLAGVCEAVLRDAALGALAAGVPLDGAALASRAVELNRFDDGAHELLVRCLARAGEVGAARDHADACEVLFRRELGRAPDPGVRRAADEQGAQSAAGGRRSGGRVGAAGRGARGRGCRRGRARSGVPEAGVCRGAGRWRPGAAGARAGGARGCAGAFRSRR